MIRLDTIDTDNIILLSPSNVVYRPVSFSTVPVSGGYQITYDMPPGIPKEPGEWSLVKGTAQILDEHGAHSANHVLHTFNVVVPEPIHNLQPIYPVGGLIEVSLGPPPGYNFFPDTISYNIWSDQNRWVGGGSFPGTGFSTRIGSLGTWRFLIVGSYADGSTWVIHRFVETVYAPAPANDLQPTYDVNSQIDIAFTAPPGFTFHPTTRTISYEIFTSYDQTVGRFEDIGIDRISTRLGSVGTWRMELDGEYDDGSRWVDTLEFDVVPPPPPSNDAEPSYDLNLPIDIHFTPPSGYIISQYATTYEMFTESGQSVGTYPSRTDRILTIVGTPGIYTIEITGRYHTGAAWSDTITFTAYLGEPTAYRNAANIQIPDILKITVQIPAGQVFSHVNHSYWPVGQPGAVTGQDNVTSLVWTNGNGVDPWAPVGDYEWRSDIFTDGPDSPTIITGTFTLYTAATPGEPKGVPPEVEVGESLRWSLQFDPARTAVDISSHLYRVDEFDEPSGGAIVGSAGFSGASESVLAGFIFGGYHPSVGRYVIVSTVVYSDGPPNDETRLYFDVVDSFPEPPLPSSVVFWPTTLGLGESIEIRTIGDPTKTKTSWTMSINGPSSSQNYALDMAETWGVVNFTPTQFGQHFININVFYSDGTSENVPAEILTVDIGKPTLIWQSQEPHLSQITIGWEGVQAAETYELQRWDNDAWATIRDAVDIGWSQVVTPGVPVRFRARTKGDGKVSDWSSDLTVTMTATPTTQPTLFTPVQLAAQGTGIYQQISDGIAREHNFIAERDAALAQLSGQAQFDAHLERYRVSGEYWLNLRNAMPTGTKLRTIATEMEEFRFQSWYTLADTQGGGIAEIFHNGGWIPAWLYFDELTESYSQAMRNVPFHLIQTPEQFATANSWAHMMS